MSLASRPCLPCVRAEDGYTDDFGAPSSDSHFGGAAGVSADPYEGLSVRETLAPSEVGNKLA